MHRTLLIVSFIAGCAAAKRPPTPMPVIDPPSVNPNLVIGTSVQGRPIALHQFGVGPRPVLVMGAIHGDEPTSAAVANALRDYLLQNPTEVPVAIIPVANPDGYAANTRTNPHQVDLNRNFPASNWSTRSNSRARKNFGGAASASEPETAALIQTIEQLRPRLIISIHSMDKPCNNYDGPAQQIAELMSKRNGYPATPTIGYATPGSLGSYAGIDRQIPMITLELPRKLDGNSCWSQNRDALLEAIASAK